MLSMQKSTWVNSHARKNILLRAHGYVYTWSHLKSVNPNLGQCKKIGGITKACGKRPPGERSQPSSKLQVLFTEDEHILFDFLFLPGQLPAQPAMCQEALRATILLWIAPVIAAFVQTSSAETTKMHKGFGGAGAGRTLEESCLMLWLQRKNLKI